MSFFRFVYFGFIGFSLAACAVPTGVSLVPLQEQTVEYDQGNTVVISDGLDLTLAALVPPNENFNDRVSLIVSITNKGSEKINVAPTDFEVSLGGSKRIALLTEGQLKKEAERAAAWASFAQGLATGLNNAAAQQNAYSQSYGTVSSGSGYATYSGTTYNPAAAQAQINYNNQQMQNNLAKIEAQKKASLKKTNAMLKLTTLSPGENTAGRLVFDALPIENIENKYTISFSKDGGHKFTFRHFKITK